MSDDTRQARIEAAMDAYNDVLHAHARGYLANNGSLHSEAMTAALDAADAVGRERVSVERDDLEHILGWIDTVDDCNWRGLHFDAIQRLNKALTAAPAERGHDETGVKQ